MEKGQHCSYLQKRRQTNIEKLPSSIAAICFWENLERLLLNELFQFFIESKLISLTQFGFKTGDSCINQLLSVTHEIYGSFDEEDLEIRSVFLDISKVFE